MVRNAKMDLMEEGPKQHDKIMINVMETPQATKQLTHQKVSKRRRIFSRVQIYRGLEMLRQIKLTRKNV